MAVTFFDDRYQKPFKGGYKDLLCLIRVNGFVCELQLNIDEMLIIKEGAGHAQYEKIRKVNINEDNKRRLRQKTIQNK